MFPTVFKTVELKLLRDQIPWTCSVFGAAAVDTSVVANTGANIKANAANTRNLFLTDFLSIIFFTFFRKKFWKDERLIRI